MYSLLFDDQLTETIADNCTSSLSQLKLCREYITRMHIAQSIDLLLMHGYNFVNFREIVEMLLTSCTGSPGDT